MWKTDATTKDKALSKCHGGKGNLPRDGQANSNLWWLIKLKTM